MPSVARAACLAGLALGAAGCELVFGLDDYARSPAADGAGGEGGEGTGSAGAGGGAGGAGSSAETTATGTATSSSTGGSAGCQCVPPIPAGWELVVRADTQLGGPETACPAGERLALGRPGADCSCTCSDLETTCDGAALRCWQEAGCTGDSMTFDLDGTCADMGADQRSCQAIPAEPAGPTCAPSGAAAPLTGDAVDLCPATTQVDATCGEGVCATIAPGERTCIRGAAPCPDGWKGQALAAHRPGDLACDACACKERTCSAPTYRAYNEFAVCGLGTDVDTSCTSVAPANVRSGWARRIDAPELEGACEAEQAVVEATYTPGEPVQLCCLAPPSE